MSLSKAICAGSSDPDLVFDFFLYNTAFQGKLKNNLHLLGGQKTLHLLC